MKVYNYGLNLQIVNAFYQKSYIIILIKFTNDPSISLICKLSILKSFLSQVVITKRAITVCVIKPHTDCKIKFALRCEINM